MCSFKEMSVVVVSCEKCHKAAVPGYCTIHAHTQVDTQSPPTHRPGSKTCYDVPRGWIETYSLADLCSFWLASTGRSISSNW
ncbi:unnamed protein product [Protopolystoma xenopodis]|uniref:Uncharacterized protein n=1 Tax=Protopolystoma xenopodis TaxID=117903 RepID=A0A3S5AK31_9PLAT|nr:unnamed protein product [Protopolystoma xenopodis]